MPFPPVVGLSLCTSPLIGNSYCVTFSASISVVINFGSEMNTTPHKRLVIGTSVVLLKKKRANEFPACLNRSI
jgi:hypothetical protein